MHVQSQPLRGSITSSRLQTTTATSTGGTPPISPHILVPDEVEDSIFLEEASTEAVMRPLEASISDKTEDPIKTTEGQQSVSTKTSVASSKSDAGTNTSENVLTDKTITNTASKNCDQWGNIRTIDELYTHCEQLVETLSQASEELKNGSIAGGKEANCQVKNFVILTINRLCMSA